ncbi:MAG: GcrA family cell cycle regulator [Caulobacter sp.]
MSTAALEKIVPREAFEAAALETGWTERRTAVLEELWMAGVSAILIGKALSVTRSMVVGKAYRMKLTERGRASPPIVQERVQIVKPGPKPKAESKPRVRRPLKAPPVKPDRNQGNTASLKIAKAAAPEAIRQSIPDQRAEDLSRTDLVQLLDLKAHHCRWPIGNPGDDRFGFCGHAKQGERPYCSLHSATAFQPTPVRNSTKELIRSVRRFA